MKLIVDLNVLVIAGMKTELFVNDRGASIYVKITDGETNLIPVNGVFHFPLTALSKSYELLVSDTADTGYYEFTDGATIYGDTQVGNKLSAVLGLDATVFEKQIAANINVKTATAIITEGLTLIGGALGLLNVVSEKAAKVTVNNITNEVYNQLAVIVGEEAAKQILASIKLPLYKFTRK